MNGSRNRTFALGSGLALLLGGTSLASAAMAQTDPGVVVDPASGFEMVPGSASAVGQQTPETPGANGFELLPAAPNEMAANAQGQHVALSPSGFEMTVPATVMRASADQAPAQAKAAPAPAPVAAPSIAPPAVLARSAPPIEPAEPAVTPSAAPEPVLAKAAPVSEPAAAPEPVLAEATPAPAPEPARVLAEAAPPPRAAEHAPTLKAAEDHTDSGFIEVVTAPVRALASLFGHHSHPAEPEEPVLAKAAEPAAPAPAAEAPVQLASAETPAPVAAPEPPAPVVIVSPASARELDPPPVTEAAPPPPELKLAAADPAPAAAPAPPPPAEEPAPAPSPEPSAPAAAPSGPVSAQPLPAAASAAAPEAPTAPAGVVISRIIVQGNERIEPSTVLSYLPIQPGEAVDAVRIDLALKTLFRTELFSDVSIKVEGSDLIVKVAENPIINQVVFEGNHNLKEDKLRDEVEVRPRGIFTRSKVEQDVQRIVELYRRSGRISATVTPKIVQLPQKRVDLIFEIDEGPKTGILDINFLGNKSFSDDALRDVIITRESHWYKFFSSHTNYDPDQMEYDREQLRKFYRNHGFYEFRIVSAVAELSPDKNGFVETFTLDEGPKYHFGKLKVTTDLKRLNGDLLQALLPIREGQLYEDERIEKATDGLTYAAGANGFAFVDIRPQYVAHPETRTVDVTFNVAEGPRVYIERIDIVGNNQTLDRVIRREMRVAEGDAYNRVLVDRSKNQIKALGFFKDVDIEQLPGSAPDKTILRVKVTEQPTGEVTFSLGYSSIEKLVGDVGITQRNFRGRGQTVNFQVSLGYLRKQIQLSFLEPRFMGRNLQAGFDVYTYRYNYSTQASFQTASTGLNLRTGFPINEYASFGLRYGLHTDKVTIPGTIVDPATGKCLSGYSQSLCEEVGSSLTSLVGYNIRWDRLNDPLHPTRGFYMDFAQDFAGLGGDVNYISTSADGAVYYGFTPSWVLSFQGSAGYITGWGGDGVRINDRFFKGGDNFRGFQIAGIGPRDVTQGTSSSSSFVGDALGGKLFAIGTVELTVPTPLPAQYGIKTALFTDFGTLGLVDSHIKRNPDGTLDTNIKDDLAFRASAGVSVFWKSPMGPLRFDFSKVLSKAPYDRTETFRFNTTTRF